MELYDPDYMLICKVAERDLAAYRELVGRHLTRCVRFAERMVGNRQDAEDIAQDVCMKIWNEAPRWKPKAKFSTWLYRVVFNACLNHRRKIVHFTQANLELFEDPAMGADEALMQKQQSQRVQAALQALPERQRAALILSYYEEMSNEDSAASLGLSVGAFQQLLFRARQSLKSSLLELPREQSNG